MSMRHPILYKTVPLFPPNEATLATGAILSFTVEKKHKSFLLFFFAKVSHHLARVLQPGVMIIISFSSELILVVYTDRQLSFKCHTTVASRLLTIQQ